MVAKMGLPRIAEEGKFDNPRHVAVSKDRKYVYVADLKMIVYRNLISMGNILNQSENWEINQVNLIFLLQ